VLLDQKRTRRTVQVVAILTSLAFAGVIFVVLGLIFFGGGEASIADQQLDDARERVAAEPRNPDAYEELASAYAGKEQFDQAIEAAERAVALAPRDFSRLQSLIALQLRPGVDQTDAAIAALQRFTEANPRDAEAFLQLGQLAEQAGGTALAGLAYQRFLELAPDDPNAGEVRERLRNLTAVTPGS
jgi:tetratricopeptide (TPR) repeat protein